jgi:hypothetical protein
MANTSARRERIIALDIMRGFFLTIIIVDHLNYFPGLFELIGGRGELWVSAAEGFFLVSGLLVGYIYTPKMIANAKAAALKIWRRAGLLYLWAMILTTIAVVWAHLAHTVGPIKGGLWWTPPIVEYIYKVMTLQYNYGWADFLQYYVLFMLFAPLAVWLCVKNKAWLVVLVSVVVYVFRGQNFNMAWQIMFMGGIVLGHYLPTLEAKSKEIPKKIHRKMLRRSLYVLAVASLLASVIITFGAAAMQTFMGSNIPAWLAPLHDTLASWNANLAPNVEKWTLEPLRVLFAALWFSALYIVVRRREEWIDKKTYGFFRTLGEVSLLVYGVHALVVFGAHLYLPEDFGYALNSVVTAVFLAFFYCLARYRKYFKLGYQKVLNKWREV